MVISHKVFCTACKRTFKTGKVKATDEDEGITRVTAKREVKTCQNALNHRDHKCVHCLCFDCHSLEAKDAGRPRRKRNDEPQLNYGEKMLADGTIVADLTNKPNDSKRRRRN